MADSSTAASQSNNGFSRARSLGRSDIWPEEQDLLEVGVFLGHGSGLVCVRTGHSRRNCHGQLFRLGELPAGWNSTIRHQRLFLQCISRHAQPGRLGLCCCGDLALEEKFLVGICRIGTPHSLRHSVSRVAIFPDSVSLAAANATARWDSLGKSDLHAGQLHVDRRGLRDSQIPPHPLKYGDRERLLSRRERGARRAG